MVNDFILLDFLICLQDLHLVQHMLFISIRSCPTFDQCTGPKKWAPKRERDFIEAIISIFIRIASHMPITPTLSVT